MADPVRSLLPKTGPEGQKKTPASRTNNTTRPLYYETQCQRSICCGPVSVRLSLSPSQVGVLLNIWDHKNAIWQSTDSSFLN